jgi:hypothetical protein
MVNAELSQVLIEMEKIIAIKLNRDPPPPLSNENKVLLSSSINVKSNFFSFRFLDKFFNR